MRDLDRALAEIGNIRAQLAAGTMFRGFGPVVIAVSGVLALMMAIAQTLWPERLANDPTIFLGLWVATAVFSAALIGVEMLARSKRLHGGMADAMIFTAIEQFLPAGAAGAAIGLVVYRYAQDAVWLLPGLWQVLVALGVFASMRTMPRSMGLVAGWYFVAGIAVLIISSDGQDLSPWAMGVPFAVGQLLMAAVLRFANGGDDADQ